jgi:hypothetical protein
MAGMRNFRDAYGLDPYGGEGTGGLLGMLQALMQQGQGQTVADWSVRPGITTQSARQASDFGQAPPTRFTVRPADPYSYPDSETPDGTGGLLGRLLALQSEQNSYQPLAENNRAAPFVSLDPNFRQLSRVPVANPTEWATNAPISSEDRSDSSYGRPVLSDAIPDPVRPGSRYAQGMLGLCAAGPPGCAIGGGLTVGQAILGGAALLGGATILNSRKKTSPTDNEKDDNRTAPEKGSAEWLPWFKEGMAAAKRARAEAARKKWAGKMTDPGDFCTDQHDKDVKECYERQDEITHRDFVAACLKQAAEHLADCRKNGGRPGPNPPRKWTPDDEDIYFETGR